MQKRGGNYETKKKEMMMRADTTCVVYLFTSTDARGMRLQHH